MSLFFSTLVKNFSRYLLTFVMLFFIFGLAFQPVYAADDLKDFEDPISQIVPCYGGNCEDQAAEVRALPQSNLRDVFLPLVVQFLIYGLGIVSFLVFFAAGAYLVLGWGEDDSIKKAKYMVIYGLLGLAIAAAAYTFVKAILQIEWL